MKCSEEETGLGIELEDAFDLLGFCNFVFL